MRLLYTQSENSTWQALITKRKKLLSVQACDMYLQGLENLQLPISYIPTPQEMNNLIQSFSNWKLVPCTKLVRSVEYFKMLANCQFPVITTIRPSDEIDYYSSPKPDLIHEYFGHGPFLTVTAFTLFMQRLAQIATSYPASQQFLLARLFWFTIEFGLVYTPEGLRAYGAGIIPSETETEHALYSEGAERREFTILDALRTPFSATAKQKVYYVILSFDNLFSLTDIDLTYALSQARSRGSFSQSHKIG